MRQGGRLPGQVRRARVFKGKKKLAYAYKKTQCYEDSQIYVGFYFRLFYFFTPFSRHSDIEFHISQVGRIRSPDTNLCQFALITKFSQVTKVLYRNLVLLKKCRRSTHSLYGYIFFKNISSKRSIRGQSPDKINVNTKFLFDRL